MKHCSATIMLLLAGLIAFPCCGRKPAKPSRQANTQWVDPTAIQPGPIMHDSLSEEQVRRIKAVRAVFSEVDASSLDEWISDFRREMDPNREILVWEAMAAAYSRFTAGKSFAIDKKKEFFGVLLAGTGAAPDDVLKHVKLSHISESDAREILRLYSEERNKMPSARSSGAE